MKRIVLETEKSRQASEDTQAESPRKTLDHQADSRTNPQHVQSPPASQRQEKLPRRSLPQVIPPEIYAVLAPSFKYGAGAGALGLFLGGAFGIVRSAPPFMFSIMTGFQWFVLASSFSASRLVVRKGLGSDIKPLTSRREIGASATAGGIAGMIGGLIRGPRNIVPGFMVFGLAGASGQAVWNSLESRKHSSESKSFWSSLSQYSPLTRLTDEDYKKIIEDRLLRVEADIAIVDDRIRSLQASGEEGKGVANKATDAGGADRRPGKD